MMDTQDLHEQAQERALRAHLRALIAGADGFLPFDRYMQEALYARGLGYYSAGAQKLGAGGDFTTAPEISTLFGRCIARQAEPLLRALPDAQVLEVGAGSGRLAFDLLQELERRDCLPARYQILEVSADLRARQRELLAQLPPAVRSRVEYLDRPPERAWCGLLVANEVLDALPCEVFRLAAGRVLQRGVGLGDGAAFQWQEREAPAALREEILRCVDPDSLGEDYVSELCPRLGPWLDEVTRTLARGVALLIDYGLPRHDYYHPGRNRGTLQCYYRHRVHEDPFLHPGLQDITAWVDFTRVAESAEPAGLEVLGFSTQAAFLLGNGIESLMADEPDADRRARLALQARQLLLPTEMGEAFKAIALGRGWDLPLAGFTVQDLMWRL